MKNIFIRTNRNFYLKHSTTATPQLINTILLNNHLINKSLSSDKKNNQLLNSQNIINKNIGMSISPNFMSKSKSKKNSLTKTNASTSLDSKTKNSKKIFSTNINIKPFLIYEEQKNEKIIQKENILNNKINSNNDIIKPEEIFHLRNYQSNLNKYSQIYKNKNEKKRLGKLIFAEMNNKFYTSKMPIKKSRDKTINDETIKIKKIIRFWKGVMNISFPLIITNKIQNKYDNNIFNNKKRNTTYSFRRINL